MEDYKYWYMFHITYCPDCGREEIQRERVYGKRPEKKEQRINRKEVYDWCQESRH